MFKASSTLVSMETLIQAQDTVLKLEWLALERLQKFPSLSAQFWNLYAWNSLKLSHQHKSHHMIYWWNMSSGTNQRKTRINFNFAEKDHDVVMLHRARPHWLRLCVLENSRLVERATNPLHIITSIQPFEHLCYLCFSLSIINFNIHSKCYCYVLRALYQVWKFLHLQYVARAIT